MSNSRPRIRAVTLTASTTAGGVACSYVHGYSFDEDAGSAATWTINEKGKAQKVAIVSLGANLSETVVWPVGVAVTTGVYILEQTGSITGLVYVSGDGKK